MLSVILVEKIQIDNLISLKVLVYVKKVIKNLLKILKSVSNAINIKINVI